MKSLGKRGAEEVGLEFGLERGDTGQTGYVGGKGAEYGRGGELSMEKDISQYVDRRTRGTEREVAFKDLRDHVRLHG